MTNPASETQSSTSAPLNEATTAPSQYLPPPSGQHDIEAANMESESEVEDEELMEGNKTSTIMNVAYYILCLIMSVLFSFPFSTKTIEWVLSPCITYAVLGSICCISKSKTRFLFAFEICLMLSAIVRGGLYSMVAIFTVSGIVILLSLLIPSFIACCIRACLGTERDKKTMSKVVIIYFLLMFIETIWYLSIILTDTNLTVLSLGVILFLYMIFLHISVACDTETIDEYFCHFANVYLCAICISCYFENTAFGLKMGTSGCGALYIILFYVEVFMM